MFPNKKYKIIYADPPWEYPLGRNKESGFWGLAENHYNTMKQDDLEILPVNQISDDNCVLFLWCTFPKLAEGLSLIKKWGFEYKTTAFVWIKNSKSTNTLKKYGLGYYTRSNAEIVMLGKKGKLDVISHSVQQIVTTTLSEHSKKPYSVRDRIIRLYGDLPRIELFARTKVHGWDVWGNDEKLQLQPLEAFTSIQ